MARRPPKSTKEPLKWRGRAHWLRSGRDTTSQGGRKVVTYCIPLNTTPGRSASVPLCISEQRFVTSGPINSRAAQVSVKILCSSREVALHLAESRAGAVVTMPEMTETLAGPHGVPAFGDRMFGMLDYRAHKLYRLLCLPFVLVGKVCLFLSLVPAIIIAQSLSHSVLIKIIVAYAIFEGIVLVVISIFLSIVFYFLKQFFFWFVDVIPSKGDDKAEAREIVLHGDFYLLNKKLENDIENFDIDDIDRYVSFLNWRARWFFPVKQRFDAVVAELKRIHIETGQQPRQLGIDGVKKVRESLPRYKLTFWEKAFVTQNYFNGMVGFAIITGVFLFT